MRHSATFRPRLVTLQLAAVACGVCLFTTASSLGQSPPRTSGLTPLDPGLTDTGPVGLSQRIMQVDFRRPMDFDQVFRFDSQGRNSREANARPLFVRQSGALSAVFPRSQYGIDRDGRLIAAIPPDTRFYIGAVPQPSPPANPAKPAPAAAHPVPRQANLPAAQPAAVSASQPVNARVTPDSSRKGTPVDQPFDGASTDSLTDDAAHARRVSELLRRALQATRPDSRPSPANEKDPQTAPTAQPR